MSKSNSSIRAASDVGGTFTDLVYFDTNAGQGAVSAVKTDTTPPDFERGVLDSLTKSGVDPASLDFFAHGSTVVINALTEKKGAKTALITTRGFRDVLEIARGNRPDLFNFNFRKPKPFVDRYLRLELDERIDYHGNLQQPADCSTLPEQLEYLKSEGVEAIAIAFLHAYTNPINELAVVDQIRRLWPTVSCIASHQVSREWREYERTNTTVLAAYVHPIARAYIERLEEGLKQGGLSGSPYMMQSNGGITTAAAAKRNPITMIESGPASGIFASAYLGKAIGENNLIVLDIGGTTAKCALIDEGQVKVSTEYHIGRTSKNPGFPIQTPVSEIVEIGNGGGSIAWIDAGNKLHVGPQSAAANPGPAAYGRGGNKATTTDANLVLGRIDPASFAGGELDPDWDAVDAAFAPLQEALSMTRIEIARGIVQIANANMVNALRLVSTNKGYDPRNFALIAFGGGGAMHAVALAEQLKVQKVIVPVNSSVFSAWGMLLTDLRRDYLLTRPMAVNADNYEQLISTFASMKNEAVRDYQEDGIDNAAAKIEFASFADMRYQGQEHTVKLPLDLRDGGHPDELAAAIDDFHAAHEKRFTYRLSNAVQIVNFHIVASVAVEKPGLAERALTGEPLESAIIGHREVDFHPLGSHRATIYDGTLLQPDARLGGPAVIQEPTVTLPIFPGSVATLDRYGNYHVDLNLEETK